MLKHPEKTPEKAPNSLFSVLPEKIIVNDGKMYHDTKKMYHETMLTPNGSLFGEFRPYSENTLKSGGKSSEVRFKTV